MYVAVAFLSGCCIFFHTYVEQYVPNVSVVSVSCCAKCFFMLQLFYLDVCRCLITDNSSWGCPDDGWWASTYVEPDSEHREMMIYIGSGRNARNTYSSASCGLLCWIGLYDCMYKEVHCTSLYIGQRVGARI
jgi:hypothetical protein